MAKAQRIQNWITKLLQIFLPVLSGTFVILLTSLGILFARGYSVNLKKKTIVKTGVVNVVTRPAGAFIWLNKEPFGKTNKALPNIKVGKYLLELYKEGYFPFKLHIRVEHALATLVHTYLVKQGEAKELQTVPKQYFKFEDGMVWLTWAQDAEVGPEFSARVKVGELYFVGVSSNILGRFKIINNTFRAELPFAGKLKDIQVVISPNRSRILLLVNGKHAFVAFVKEVAKFEKDEYLSSYLERGAKLEFLDDNYVVILEPGRRAIAYNLRSKSKVLLYDSINKERKPIGFCSDLRDGRALFVSASAVMIVNKEGTLEVSYDLKKLETRGEVPINCKLISTGRSPTIALIYKDRFVLLGALFRDSTKRIYSVDTFKHAKGFKIVRLYEEDAKNAEIVGLVAPTSQRIQDIIPLINLDRVILVYPDRLLLFTYNKESPDIMSMIGFKELYRGDSISVTQLGLGGDYIFCVDKTRLVAVSVYGENVYTLAEQVEDFYINESVRALLFIKKVDKTPVLFLKEL